MIYSATLLPGAERQSPVPAYPRLGGIGAAKWRWRCPPYIVDGEWWYHWVPGMTGMILTGMGYDGVNEPYFYEDFEEWTYIYVYLVFF